MAVRERVEPGAKTAPGPARPRIYVAHPMSSYKTAHARRLVERLGKLLPGAEVLDPEKLGWPTSDAWLDAWPDVLSGLAGFVLFAATDETVGLGCVLELTDALAAGVALAGLDASGLRRMDGFRLLPERSRTARAMARLVLGPRIAPASYVQTLANGGSIRP